MTPKEKDFILAELNPGMLEEIFSKQSRFQHALGYPVEVLTGNARQKYIEFNTIALIDEIMESLRETPWKPWKKLQQFNSVQYKEELVDALHFFVNLCLAAGFTSDELYDSYCKKMKINVERQMEKY